MGDESKGTIPDYESMGLTKDDLYDVEKSMKFWMQLSEEDFALRIVHDIKMYSQQIIDLLKSNLMNHGSNIAETDRLYAELKDFGVKNVRLAEILARYFEHHRAQGDGE